MKLQSFVSLLHIYSVYKQLSIQFQWFFVSQITDAVKILLQC